MHRPTLGCIIRRENLPEQIRSYAQHVEAVGYDEVWLLRIVFLPAELPRLQQQEYKWD
jgi:hypothetical protein